MNVLSVKRVALLLLLCVARARAAFDDLDLELNESPAYTELLGQSGANVAPVTFDNCKLVEVVSGSRTVPLRLLYTERSRRVTLSVTAERTDLVPSGWLGIGRVSDSQSNSMQGTSIVFAYTDGQTGYVASATGSGYGKPGIDASSKVAQASIGVADNKYFHVRFEIGDWDGSQSLVFALRRNGFAHVRPNVNSPFPGPKHTGVLRLNAFDFTTPSQCRPARPATLNGVALRSDVVERCIERPSGSRSLTSLFTSDGKQGGKLTLAWRHNCEQATTKFTLTGESAGWVAIGFKNGPLNDPVMAGGDFYQFSADNAFRDGYVAEDGINALPTQVPLGDGDSLIVGTPEAMVIGGDIVGIFERKWDSPEGNTKYAQLAAVDKLTVFMARVADNTNFNRQHVPSNGRAVEELLDLFGQQPATGGMTDDGSMSDGECDDVQGELTEMLAGAPVNIAYTIDCEAQTATFTVTGEPGEGWLAIGFNPEPRMSGSDIYQMKLDGGDLVVRHASALGLTVANGELLPASALGDGKLDDGKLTATFTRPLAALREGDVEILEGKALYVNVARHATSDNFEQQHTDRSEGTKQIDFFVPGAAVDASTVEPTDDDTERSVNAAPAANPCDSATEFSNKVSVSFEEDEVEIEYKVNCADETIELTVRGESGGWLAIGFNDRPGSMSGTDIYQVSVDDGDVKVQNGWAPGRSVTRDADIEAVAGSRNGDKLEVTFVRPLGADSDNDRALSFDSPWHIVIARGNSQNFASQHAGGVANRAWSQEPIQLFTTDEIIGGPGAVGSVNVLYLVHGLLMATAWGAASVVGSFFARFLKELGHQWYIIHRLIMSIVVFLTVVGFVLILIETGGSFQLVHSYIGIVVVILSLAQPVIGILANRWWSPEREGTPIFPDMVHWWLGRLLLLLGFINVVLGVATFHDPTFTNVTPAIIVALLLGVLLLVYYVIGQLKIGAVHHDASAGEINKVDAEAQALQWRSVSFAVLAVGILLGLISVIIAEPSFVAPL